MVAQYNDGNSKLETGLYVYMQQRKKWRKKSSNFFAGIIQFLKNCNGKLKQLYFEILLNFAR